MERPEFTFQQRLNCSESYADDQHVPLLCHIDEGVCEGCWICLSNEEYFEWVMKHGQSTDNF